MQVRPLQDILHARFQGMLRRVPRIPVISEVQEQAAAKARKTAAHSDPVLGGAEKAVQENDWRPLAAKVPEGKVHAISVALHAPAGNKRPSVPGLNKNNSVTIL